MRSGPGGGERLAESVADQADGQDGDHDGKPREEAEPGCFGPERQSGEDHTAPRRGRGLSAASGQGRTGLGHQDGANPEGSANAAADAGAATTAVDGHDRRKVRVEIEPTTRAQIIQRAGNNIADALATHAPALTPDERAELEHHLSEAERLLQMNTERSDR